MPKRIEYYVFLRGMDPALFVKDPSWVSVPTLGHNGLFEALECVVKSSRDRIIIPITSILFTNIPVSIIKEYEKPTEVNDVGDSGPDDGFSF